jgi:hypothetical protein
MSRMQNKPLPARIIVKIVPFLGMEVFRANVFRMSRWLPETVCAVIPRSLGECSVEGGRHRLTTILGQLSARELAEVSQGCLQSPGVKPSVKDNQVHMRGHDHEGINAQFFLLITET